MYSENLGHAIKLFILISKCYKTQTVVTEESHVQCSSGGLLWIKEVSKVEFYQKPHSFNMCN